MNDLVFCARINTSPRNKTDWTLLVSPGEPQRNGLCIFNGKYCYIFTTFEKQTQKLVGPREIEKQLKKAYNLAGFIFILETAVGFKFD